MLLTTEKIIVIIKIVLYTILNVYTLSSKKRRVKMKIKEVKKLFHKGGRKSSRPIICVCAFVLMALLTVSVAALLSVNGAKSSIPLIKEAKGLDFTDNSYMAEKLDELFELLPYSEYPYFTTYGNKSCGNSSCSYCNGYNVSRYHPMLKEVGVEDSYYSWSCFAFARYAYLYIFGEPADGINYYGNTTAGQLRRVGRVAANTNDLSSIEGSYETYTLSSLKALLEKATPGDIVQMRNRSVSGGVGNHTVIFLKADDEGIYVLHNNAFRGREDEEGNLYGYNRVLVSYYTYDTIKSTWNSIVTVLRAPKDTYDETWSKGYNVCVNHSFTEQNKDVCGNCGAKFERIITTDCIGTYKLGEKKTLYTEPYGSSQSKGTVTGNVIVVSKEVNSIGESWYRTVDGVYFKDGNVTKIENSDTLTISMTLYPVGEKQLYSAFSLKGRIFSLKDELTKVGGYIIDSKGKTLQRVSFNPKATSLDVGSSDLNFGLKFGQLNTGEYKLVLTASDGDGCNTVFVSSFKIVVKATEVKKGKIDPPKAPTYLMISDTFVLLEYFDGYEYSMDGEKWQTGNLFADLEANTQYNFYCRWAETETTYASEKSAALRLNTLKAQVAAQTPKLDGEAGDRWIKLVEVEEHEYSKDGINWQSSPMFTGLKPATQYVFFQRDKDVKKSSAALVVMTTKTVISAPDAPTVIGRSDTSISVLCNAGYEYAILEFGSTTSTIEWLDMDTFTGEFTGLSPAREYHIYCRVAETEVSFASEISKFTKETTDKTYVMEAPDMPVVLSKNSTTLVVLPVEGCEYSLDGEEFQKSNIFVGLVAGMSYEVVCRYSETDTAYPSEISAILEVEIVPDVVTSSVYNINEEKNLVVGIKNGTTVGNFLQDIDQGKYAIVNGSEGKLESEIVLSTGNEIVINDLHGAVAKYTLVVQGDLNMDGAVNLTDMLILLAILPEEPDHDSLVFHAADINMDGRLNALDYAIIKFMLNEDLGADELTFEA